ncbi:MAG: FtsX-like permease family protein [Bacilli bacterium]|nr:FtsX-like permease family protein [Bacilli bacterium]
MISTLFIPFLKKHLGIFISMIVVSMLSIALLCSFGSTLLNLSERTKFYMNEYGNIDEQISTDFEEISNLQFENVEGVNLVDTRIVLDTYMEKKDGRVITARMFSFNEEKDTIFKRIVREKDENCDKDLRISIATKFANNNGYKLGDPIRLGYYHEYLTFYIDEIVDCPETIYPRANDYIWSDNQDFGYLYISEKYLAEAFVKIKSIISYKMGVDAQYRAEIAQLIQEYKEDGISIPDFNEIGEDFVNLFANQVMVQNKEGYDQDSMMDKLKTDLESKEVTIKSATKGDDLPSHVYMRNVIKQLSVCSVFLPLFFYFVTMTVISLFMVQIIKSMTRDIGVMMSIGISPSDIRPIFLLYVLLMAVIAGVLGLGIGFGLNSLMTSIMIKAYSIPILASTLNPGVVIGSILGLAFFAEAAAFVSCSMIFKITPKDATLENEAHRKPMPKWIRGLFYSAPRVVKLGINSIVQNPRRFLISIFSIFSSFVIVLITLFFAVSKNEIIAQSCYRRLTYDCQVYLPNVSSQEDIDDIKKQDFIVDFEDCYYAYVEIENKEGENLYLESVAIDTGAGKLVTIPGRDGQGDLNIEEEGLILPLNIADELKVKEGDYITINQKQVKIYAISFQYFHPVMYLSKSQLTALGVKYVSTYMVNINSEEQFLSYLSDHTDNALTVFSKSLAKDLRAVFDPVDIFIVILIGFSLSMALVILAIMSQNSLMEQKRKLSIYRCIGFKISDISAIWGIESFIHIILSTIFAVPIAIFAAMLLFAISSTNNQIYPFVFTWPGVALAFGFILLVVTLCHLLSMFTINKWNLADNTRSRE